MMNKDKGKKEDGDKILNNYKKQIAEKQAREKATRGETLRTQSTSKRVNTLRGSKMKRLESDDYGITQNNFNNNNAENLEPEVLLQILNGKFPKM